MQQIVRDHMRERTLLPAKIFFNDKQSVFDCVVKNISSGGARLRVASPLGIPDQFTLLLPSLEKRFSCWIVWRNMSEIGVSFSPRQASQEAPDLHLVKDL